MDHDTFSAIAHRDHRYLNPIGRTTMEALFGLLHLGPGSRVVDVGCGKAEALIRLVELYGVHAVGIDRNARFIAAARSRADAVVPDGQLDLHEIDIGDFHVAPGAFDVALCIGSTHLYGGLRETLTGLSKLVGVGGTAVVGEGFWRKPAPDPAYLEFLGAAATDLETHAGNQALVAESGWELMRSWASTDDEWDAYEEMYLAGVERHARDNPDEPEVPAMLARIRTWHHHYQFYGRFNLGFGLYLVRRR